MNKKRFAGTFFVLASIVWSGSWWLWWVFHKVVHWPGYSQAKFMGDFGKISLFFCLVYLLLQAIRLKKGSSGWPSIAGRVFLSIAGFGFVFFSASRTWNAEGLDIVFYFILALISGFLTYRQVTRFDFKGFLLAFLAWVLIISVNELIQHSLPMREGSTGDFGSNMAGVLVGLLLSIRWLRKP